MSGENIEKKILLLNEKINDFRNKGHYIQAIALSEYLRDLASVASIIKCRKA